MKSIYGLLLLLLLILVFPLTIKAQLRFDEHALRAYGIDSQHVQDALNDKELRPGESSIYLYINDRYIGKNTVWRSDQGAPALSERTVRILELKKTAVTRMFSQKGTRYFLLSDSISSRFSRSDDSLRLTIPSALMNNPDFLRKARGGVAAFVNYNGFVTSFQGAGGDSHSLNANYELGANAANTLFRANGTLSSYASRQQQYSNQHVQSFYADRDFAFGNLKGGRLNSPDGGFGVGYLDGVVYGSTNATTALGTVAFSYDTDAPSVVEFYQRDQLVYSLNINRGHTELGAIPVTSLTADVVVVVRRDGQVIDTRRISRAQISRSTADNSGLYAFAGRSTDTTHAMTVGAGYTKRYNRLLNPSVGVVVQKKYQGASLSNTLEAGAVRMNTYALVARNERGRVGLNVNGSLSYGQTDITYQLMSRDFSYLGQALYDYHADLKGSLGLSRSFSLAHSQAISVSFARYTFYDRSSYNTWSLGYATRIGRASLNVSAGYATQAPGDTTFDKLTLAANLSIPFDIGQRRSFARAQYNAYNTTQRLDSYVTTAVTDQYSLTAGHVQSRHDDVMSRENYLSNDLSTPYTRASLSLAQSEGGDQRSTSASAALSGSVAISHKGIVFSPDTLMETYAIVDTHQRGFVTVNSTQTSVVTNHDGKAVLPNLAPERAEFVQVSPKGLPDGVYFKNNRQDFISTRGSVGFFDFAPTDDRNVLLRWLNKPAGIGTQTLFYDAQGNLMASFIDPDVLLVRQDHLPELVRSGMISSIDNDLVCRLPTTLEITHESIIDTTFDCTPPQRHLDGGLSTAAGAHLDAGAGAS